MQGTGAKKRRPGSSLRYQLVRLVVCCVGSVICLFMFFRYMGRRLSSNGTAVGMASLTAASDLMVLGTSPRKDEMDESRVQQTLHSMSAVLDRIVRENAQKRNRKYNMLKLPSQRNDGDGVKHTVSLTESKSKGGMNGEVGEKITRKGIRARMDDDGEKVDDSFAPAPKRTAGAAEIGMMKQSAKNLVPQLLDLMAALSALPPDVYVKTLVQRLAHFCCKPPACSACGRTC